MREHSYYFKISLKTHQNSGHCDVSFFDGQVKCVVPPRVDGRVVDAIRQEDATHVGQVALRRQV